MESFYLVRRYAKEFEKVYKNGIFKRLDKKKDKAPKNEVLKRMKLI